MQASREGTPVRLVSTLSVSHRRFEISPVYPFDSVAVAGVVAGAGDEVDPAFGGGEDPPTFCIFAAACWT